MPARQSTDNNLSDDDHCSSDGDDNKCDAHADDLGVLDQDEDIIRAAEEAQEGDLDDAPHMAECEVIWLPVVSRKLLPQLFQRRIVFFFISWPGY